ncbi:MAG: AraC family transcriptional regulator [Clostridia bacterium]|nr:AraC family transcriptional regulator [Clostridia bacterium]
MIDYCVCGITKTTRPWKHLSRKVNDSHELILMQSGTMYIAEENNQYVVEAGDILFLHKDVWHEGYRESTKPICFYWLHFNCSDEETIPFPAYAHVKDPSRLSNLFLETLYLAQRRLDDASLATTILVHEALAAIADPVGEENAIVEQICAWAKNNCHLDITVEKAANIFNYNKEYISKLIKREKSIGLKKYITHCRTEKAKSLLIETTLSIKEIAPLCGFNEERHFMKVFKQAVGCTPSEFRNSKSYTYKSVRSQ